MTCPSANYEWEAETVLMLLFFLQVPGDICLFTCSFPLMTLQPSAQHWRKSLVSFLHQPVVWLVAATPLGTSCREGKMDHGAGKHLKFVSQCPVSTPLSPSWCAADGGRPRTHLCSTHSNSQAGLCTPRKCSHDIFPKLASTGYLNATMI